MDSDLKMESEVARHNDCEMQNKRSSDEYRYYVETNMNSRNARHTRLESRDIRKKHDAPFWIPTFFGDTSPFTDDYSNIAEVPTKKDEYRNSSSSIREISSTEPKTRVPEALFNSSDGPYSTCQESTSQVLQRSTFSSVVEHHKKNSSKLTELSYNSEKAYSDRDKEPDCEKPFSELLPSKDPMGTEFAGFEMNNNLKMEDDLRHNSEEAYLDSHQEQHGEKQACKHRSSEDPRGTGFKNDKNKRRDDLPQKENRNESMLKDDQPLDRTYLDLGMFLQDGREQENINIEDSSGSDIDVCGDSDMVASGGTDMKVSGGGSDMKASSGSDIEASGGSDIKVSGGSDIEASSGSDMKASSGSELKAFRSTDMKVSGDTDIDASGGPDMKAFRSTDMKVSGDTDIDASRGTDMKISGDTDNEASGGSNMAVSVGTGMVDSGSSTNKPGTPGIQRIKMAENLSGKEKISGSETPFVGPSCPEVRRYDQTNLLRDENIDLAQRQCGNETDEEDPDEVDILKQRREYSPSMTPLYINSRQSLHESEQPDKRLTPPIERTFLDINSFLLEDRLAPSSSRPSGFATLGFGGDYHPFQRQYINNEEATSEGLSSSTVQRDEYENDDQVVPFIWSNDQNDDDDVLLSPRGVSSTPSPAQDDEDLENLYRYYADIQDLPYEDMSLSSSSSP